MQTWRECMPIGGKLKSEGFASNLSDPEGQLTLGAFCRERGLRYSDTNYPVDRDVFADYGEAFQRRYVPDLERTHVTLVEKTSDGFEIALESGECLTSRCVIVASGIRPFHYTPKELSGLSTERLTHSGDYGDAKHLAGKDVVVIGAGASATDTAALLRRCGARPRILTRRKQIRFQTSLGERSLLERIRAPMTGLGPGWKSVLCCEAPLLFHVMPEGFRTEIVRRYLGPAPAWFVRDEVEGHVPFIVDSQLLGAEETAEGVRIRVSQPGGESVVETEHVIAATGYRVDTNRLNFLSGTIRGTIRRVEGSPALSSTFESSVPGLYFVGTSAAVSFGPMLRFAYGADFAARRISRALAPRRNRRSADQSPAHRAVTAR
jgi:thioredoxin reductase